MPLSKSLVALSSVLVLVACDGARDAPPRVSKEERARFAERAKDMPVSTRTYYIMGSQLLVVDVPTGGSQRHVESQKCFVWRDAEFKSASIQCPADSPGDIQMGGPTTESPHP